MKRVLFYHAGRSAIVWWVCWMCTVGSGPLSGQTTGVSINSSGAPPDPKAMLDVSAADKGILIPRISMLMLPAAPPTGLMVYVQDLDPGFWYYTGTAWAKLLPAAEEKWQGTPNIFYSAGNVGIGTTAPSLKLAIDASGTSDNGINLNHSGSGDPMIRLQVGGSTKFTMGIDNSDADKFKIGGGSVSTATKMTITQTGNVGIGTENPTANLQVSGTAKVFGPWETKSHGVNYQAATDGFVIAGLIINSGSGDANAMLKGFTDSNPVPVAIRGLACVRKYYPATQNNQESFTMPVRKGDYWRVEYTYIEGSISYNVEWLPLGGNNP